MRRHGRVSRPQKIEGEFLRAMSALNQCRIIAEIVRRKSERIIADWTLENARVLR
jgi:hypothetical protein